MQPRKHLTNVLDTDKIGPLMVKLSMPAFLGMFVQSMYNVISTIFLGHYVGALGIAGLSIAFPLQMLGFGLANLSGIGGMSLISRYIGSKDYAKAEQALGNGVSLAIFLGLFVIAGLLPFLDFWLTLIGASDEVLPYARDYMMFVTIGMLAQTATMAFLNYARAEGNARVGMIAMIMGALVNIALSAMFIIWLDMGAKGAGLATLIAQVSSLGYTASYYLLKKSYLKLRLKNLYPNFKVLKEIFSIGIGAFMQHFAGSLSSMLLISMVVSYGGDYALSAFGIVQRIQMFASMPAMVIAQGVQPILGFNYGARRFKLVLKCISMGMTSSIVLTFVTWGIVYFVPEPIVRLFSNDPQLITVGVEAARGIMVVLPIVGPIMVGTMVFQAIGKPGRAFIAAVSRPVIFMIPSLFILAHFLGIMGVWYTFAASDVLTLIAVALLLIPIIKQVQRAAADEDKTRLSASPGTIVELKEARRPTDA